MVDRHGTVNTASEPDSTMGSKDAWHIRRASAEHYQWFRNLGDLHALTLAWIQELNLSKAQLLKRGLTDEVSQTLWMLEGLSEVARTPDTALDNFLDDTTATDLVARLERTVWAVQAWTLSFLTKSLDETQIGALRNQLEQISWKCGRDCAQARWPVLNRDARSDLRGILYAFYDSPLAGFPHQDGFLVKRAIAREIQVELLACPHRSRYAEVSPIADELCRQHLHWMKGFAYALNTTVVIEAQLKSHVRCAQRWYFNIQSLGDSRQTS